MRTTFSHTSILLLSLALTVACGDEEKSDNGANSGATNNGATNNGATNNGATNNGATNNGATNNGAGMTITVGVFRRLDETTYEQITVVEPLVFQPGVDCQSWSRRVENPSAMDTTQEPHDHFNAADQVTYENDTLTWVEYGPEHTQDDIDALCDEGVDGTAPKTVTSTDYTFDGNMGEMDANGNYIGFYLKIISAE